MLEGDANLTAILLSAARQGVRPERAVERVRIATSSMTPQQLVEFDGHSPKLLASSPLVRDLFLFPTCVGKASLPMCTLRGGWPWWTPC